MGDDSKETTTIFGLRKPENRDKRYEIAVRLVPKLAAKNYPTEKVIRILNRLGVTDDEHYQDNPQETANKGKYRKEGRLIMYRRKVQGEFEQSFGMRGGGALKEFMVQFGQSIDKLLHDSNNDPYEIAAYSILVLGDIHPFPEGNGRTQRLLMNYVLAKKNCR